MVENKKDLHPETINLKLLLYNAYGVVVVLHMFTFVVVKLLSLLCREIENI